MQFPGAVYHVMSRGDRRENIFQSEADRELFLQTLAEACLKAGFQIHAYCLMSNHFHLVVETPRGNLVAGMKWLLGVYTARFNRRHGVVGHLFSGRYKSTLISGAPGYLRTACQYVHLNPARAGLLRPAEPIQSYRWSSYPRYLASPGKRPAWLRTDRLLGELNLSQDNAASRRRLAAHMEAWRASEDGELYTPLRHGWFLGGEEEKESALEQVRKARRASHYGEEIRQSDERQAEALIARALRERGWKASDLRARRKGDPGKLEIAEALREQSSMSVKWIAERLHMGASTHLSHLLYWSRRRRAGA